MIERKELASYKQRRSFYFPCLHNPKSQLSSVSQGNYPIYITEYLLDLFIYYPTTMDFDRLCKDILGLDSKIRFAGVCDDSGEIRYGGQREGIPNLLSKDETKRSNLQAIARWALRSTLLPKVGRGRYAMAEYEKIKRITFPLEETHLLLVTTEVDADHNKVIRDILTMLTR
jgi:hypothetical protein